MQNPEIITSASPKQAGSDTLFDLGSVRMDSPRLREVKKHDIQAHFSPHIDKAPWLAIPMKAAREILKGYNLTKDEAESVVGIFAGYCRLLDDAGMIFEGDSEREVQDTALEFCRNLETLNAKAVTAGEQPAKTDT